MVCTYEPVMVYGAKCRVVLWSNYATKTNVVHCEVHEVM